MRWICRRRGSRYWRCRSARPASGRSATVAEPAIAARGLSLVFRTNDGPVHALSDVNLDIAPGEFISLIGPSGCGKTTLLRVIADLERPTGGEIRVNGVTPEAARLARDYGYVFQAPALFPWRPIEGNVML
ncbi:MAG: ATP-binding cassette domain-containing protein, partial [Roseomonas sp.]|nr:ATP-binding cassette domain-containing protein [Roseomonas sp.]